MINTDPIYHIIQSVTICTGGGGVPIDALNRRHRALLRSTLTASVSRFVRLQSPKNFSNRQFSRRTLCEKTRAVRSTLPLTHESARSIAKQRCTPDSPCLFTSKRSSLAEFFSLYTSLHFFSGKSERAAAR